MGSSDRTVTLDHGRAESYPAVLARRSIGVASVRSFARPGATFLRASDRPFANSTEYQDAINSSPDIVLLMLGTNDAKSAHWNETSFRTDAAVLVRRFAALASRPAVYLLAPPPLYKDNIYGISQHVVNDVLPFMILPEIAAAGEVLFSRSIFDSLGGQGLTCQSCMYEPGHVNDGCHPTDHGYAMMAETICDLLRGEGDSVGPCSWPVASSRAMSVPFLVTP